VKIVVATELPDAALEELRALGADVNQVADAGPAELPKLARDAAILVVGATRISGDVFSAGRSLQLVVRTGADVSNIAVDEASVQGVFVSGCPHRDAEAVAELTFGLLLVLDRRLAGMSASGREAHGRAAAGDSAGLAGRTLGVIGFGPVGTAVARRARAFDMNVVVWSTELSGQPDGRHEAEFCATPRELARRSEFIASYAPPEGPDELLIDDDVVRCIREGACLVHVGHPGAIDEAALAEAVRERGLRLAIDLEASEPSIVAGRIKSPLYQLPGVIATQNLAGATRQARDAVAQEVVRIIKTFLVSGEALNCVNLAERSPATWQLLLRVRDQVGVMASILDAIRADGINAEEVSSRVFTGAKAAFIAIALDERPSGEALAAIRKLPDVLHLDLRAMV
jgi:D-3-phosphoglycerate dehydrogenase